MAHNYMRKIVREELTQTEVDIRRIVRDEMYNVLKDVCKSAEVPSYINTDKIENALVGIIETVSGAEVVKHEDGFHGYDS